MSISVSAFTRVTFTCWLHRLSPRLPPFPPSYIYVWIHLRLMKTEPKVRRDGRYSFSPDDKLSCHFPQVWPAISGRTASIFCFATCASSCLQWTVIAPSTPGRHSHQQGVVFILTMSNETLVSQDGQMKEVWCWLILRLSVCPSIALSLSNQSVLLLFFTIIFCWICFIC